MAGPGVFTPYVIDLMTGYASDSYRLAQDAIDALATGISDTELSLPTPPAVAVISPETAPEFTDEVGDSADAPTEPDIATYNMPIEPSYSLPAVPTLSTFTIPTFVDGTIRPMTSSIPTVNFAVPNPETIAADDISYDSLYGTVRDKLESNITNGGTMIDSDVEDDIWNRDLERNEQALQDAVDKVTGQWAKFGFSMPDGLLAGNILALNNEYLNDSLKRSREIAIKQAELEQAGMFKSLELGVSFENMAMSSLAEFGKMRLDAAKANGDILIAVFQQRVNLFNASLEAYKTDALVYKTSIEAEIARAEVYKTKMGGLQILAQMDESKVKIYSAQIGAIEQLANIYNTQVKAVATMYEAERVKVELFKGKVDAYSASLDAVTKQYIGSIEAFKGKIQGYASKNDVEIKNVEVGARVSIATYEASVKLMETVARVAEVAAQVRMEGLRAAAQASSNLAAGAMSAIHASVSDAYQNTYSQNHTYLEK